MTYARRASEGISINQAGETAALRPGRCPSTTGRTTIFERQEQYSGGICVSIAEDKDRKYPAGWATTRTKKLENHHAEYLSAVVVTGTLSSGAADTAGTTEFVTPYECLRQLVAPQLIPPHSSPPHVPTIRLGNLRLVFFASCSSSNSLRAASTAPDSSTTALDLTTTAVIVFCRDIVIKFCDLLVARFLEAFGEITQAGLHSDHAAATLTLIKLWCDRCGTSIKFAYHVMWRPAGPLGPGSLVLRKFLLE